MKDYSTYYKPKASAPMRKHGARSALRAIALALVVIVLAIASAAALTIASKRQAVADCVRYAEYENSYAIFELDADTARYCATIGHPVPHNVEVSARPR